MFIIQESKTDWLLVGLVAIILLAANTAGYSGSRSYVDDQFLVYALIAVTTLGIIRYFRFSAVVLICMLSIGANLPDELATRLGVSSNISLAALIIILVASLANHFFKTLPVGTEDEYIAKKPEGCGTLLKAIDQGDLAKVRSLVENGVNVNTCTIYGTTPLMFAASKGYYDIAKCLLENGADPQARTKRGDTALYLAEHIESDHLAELIRSAVLGSVPVADNTRHAEAA